MTYQESDIFNSSEFSTSSEVGKVVLQEEELADTDTYVAQTQSMLFGRPELIKVRRSVDKGNAIMAD